MRLHIDGSEHGWFQEERGYDWLGILDDANREIYYPQLGEEEATATVLAGLPEVVEQNGASARGRAPSVATTSAAVRSATRNWRPARR